MPRSCVYELCRGLTAGLIRSQPSPCCGCFLPDLTGFTGSRTRTGPCGQRSAQLGRRRLKIHGVEGRFKRLGHSIGVKPPVAPRALWEGLEENPVEASPPQIVRPSGFPGEAPRYTACPPRALRPSRLESPRRPHRLLVRVEGRERPTNRHPDEVFRRLRFRRSEYIRRGRSCRIDRARSRSSTSERRTRERVSSAIWLPNRSKPVRPAWLRLRFG